MSASDSPFVWRLEIPEKIQNKKWAGQEIIDVSHVCKHKKSEGAFGIGYDTGEIGNRGYKIDKDNEHCKNKKIS